MRRGQGWTLLEVMAAGSLLLLLVGWSTLSLVSYLRTLTLLQREGDQMARAAHAVEHLQREILASQPLPPGQYSLGAQALILQPLTGGTTSLTLMNGKVTWAGKSQGPAQSVALRIRVVGGHSWGEIQWEMPAPLPRILCQFDATVRP